jgi:hypothetical protein
MANVSGAVPLSAVGTQAPPRTPSEQIAPAEANPLPFLPTGCPPGEHDVRTWKRIAPWDVTTDRHFSLNYSPCTWSVSVRDSKVVATAHEDAEPAVPPGFVLPETWGPPRVIVRGRSGVLFGFDRGEWGGALLWYSDDGGFRQKLLKQNIVGILPTQGGFIAFAGLSHLGMDRGRVIELVDAGGAFRIGRSMELGSAPSAMVREADGAVLVATTRGLLRVNADFRVELLLATRWGMFYPTSLAIDRDGTAYVGMRGIVAEVHLATKPPDETWRSPVALDRSSP